MTNIKNKKGIHALLITMAMITVITIFMSCSAHKKLATSDLISVKENNKTVIDFISYVDANNKLIPNHQVINNALVKLADAANAMAGEIGYTITDDLNKAKEHANKITNDPNESTHSDNIRKSVNILTNALQSMQQAKYPTLSTASSELKSASEAIKPEIQTNNQKDAIVDFFRRSAYLLERMN